MIDYADGKAPMVVIDGRGADGPDGTVIRMTATQGNNGGIYLSNLYYY
jgi:hypothetical protein